MAKEQYTFWGVDYDEDGKEVDKADKVDETCEDTITISMATYTEMIAEIDWLHALEEAGVDNWGGYDYAQELYRDR